MQLIDLAAQQRRIRDRIDAAVAAVLDHGQYIMGPEVARLEDRLADFVGGDTTVVTCSSGTDALLLALMARGVGPGDAVFVPGFTFPATAETIALLGATPVFVDVEPESYGLDLDRLAEAVATLPPSLRPAGVIPVDLYGLPTDHRALAEVTDPAGLWVVTDAAQSFGGSRAGIRVGTLTPVTTTSFFPAKPLGCYGDGGAVLTTDEGLAAVLRSLRVHGAGEHKYDIVRIGINGRLDTIQAAVLLVKLDVLADEIDRRQQVAVRYHEALALVAGITVPHVAPEVVSAWAQYTIRVEGRDAVAARLRDAGVPTAVYYPRPLHRQAPYAGFWRPTDDLPVAARLADTVLSLPMHPYLEPSEQDVVIDAVTAAVGTVG